ncbi:MAG: type I-B CRISPR-associated endonuclease Cas1b [Candidatus Thermoplasmatota archaeon]
MKTNYYITKDGVLRRKENTVYFIDKTEQRALPIQKIYAIYAYGNLSFTSGVVSYLAKNGVPIHFFNSYGFYEGSLYPRETLVSGDATIKQAEHYLDGERRSILAKLFVEGAAKNILRNLNYYSKDTNSLTSYIEKIEHELGQLPGYTTIPQIMSVEGHIRDFYYSALDCIFPAEFQIGERVKRPPNNKTNTLLSFGNSLMYATVLSEIYNTQLNPTISFLHEPFERRFSLSLDVAEIFKPIIVDRVIFKLINKNMLDETDFSGDIGNMLLSESGRKKFLQEYHERLSRTIEHKGLGREVSYQRLIRLELYKLVKHVLGTQKYKPLVMWW